MYNKGTFTMEDGTISGNSAALGGGVHHWGDTFTMKDGSISGNSAISGGGVFLESSPFEMSGGTISGNTATYVGGGVYNKGTFTMEDGTISGNTAAYEGGGMCNVGTFTLLKGGTISGNTAAADGGGVYNYNAGTFTMEDGTISGNTAAADGGGVYNNGTFAMEKGTISAGTISGNTAAADGGGVYNNTGKTFTMNDGAISGNTAGANGGGVFNFGTFTMSGGTISGNTAVDYSGDGVCAARGITLSGGAVVADEVYLGWTETITVGANLTGSALVRPSGTYSDDIQVLTAGQTYLPGVLACFSIVPEGTVLWGIEGDGTLILLGDAVAKVSAAGQRDKLFPTFAEAVTAANARGKATITLLDDIELESTAVIASGKDITLTADGEYRIERKTGHSGSMLNVYGTLRLTGGGGLTIDGEEAEGGDNSLVTVQSGGRLDMHSDVTLTGGRASWGGGVYNLGTFRMFGGTITGNYAASMGGGVENFGGTFRMTGGTITLNSASSDGGGVDQDSGTSTLSGGTISDNTAGSYGGGMCCFTGTFTLSGATLSGNTANYGGGAFAYFYASLTVNGGSFKSNTANYGGGLYARSVVKLNTAGVFEDSPLYLEAAPDIDNGKSVHLKLTADDPLGELPVIATNAVWLLKSDFDLDDMDGYGLLKVPHGTAGGALMVCLATTTTVSVSNITYGGTPAPTATVMQGSETITEPEPTITYATAEDGPYGDTVPEDAGDYWVKASYAGDAAEYLAPSEGTAAFTIAKATPGVVLSPKTENYNGALIEINPAVVTGLGSEEPVISYEYSLDEFFTPIPFPVLPVSAGTYYVRALLAESDNYNEVWSNTVTLTIDPVEPTVTLKDKKADYTGKPIKIGKASVKGIFGEALSPAVTYQYYRDALLTKPLSGPPTDAGTYYVTASVEEDGSYTEATSNTAKLTIVEAEEEGEEEEEEQITQIVVINGVEIELVVGPTEDLTINGETYEGPLVDSAGRPRAFTAHIEAVEALNEETGQPEIVQVVLFITAEPDLDENGEPVLGDDGNPRFSQRNLQLEPEWIRELAALGITDICYTLKDASLMLPLSAFEGEGLEAATRFSVRVAPIYEGETRPAEDSALAGYSVESGLYRVYIVMETEDGEADIAALLAGAALRLPAEEEIAPEEQERFGMLFVPVEGEAAVLT
ncbi:MAG: hypothetical protein GX592_01690, partial [Clostridiales bacterium]|nr:hypothetical protein [Clostridiales bacterium]